MAGFKVSEIIVIVIALAIPIGMFTALMIPGVGAAIIHFMLESDRLPWIFYSGAVVLFALLAWRFYRRIRPKSRTPDDSAGNRTP
jgi:membrane protein implicated in regulation of membrane protease activity